ncbi:G-type lectin S-receptor-like serine/threonine-protein kinase LECRK1 [Durio zibethinus]|uniref:Receptor-like serine/threonine-protein kinase n=1 Tax=Durio zibethinus TaxID=66656 RepID=A0A6P5ZDP7_DURZI|nr:G-type lectin S-receptor-like serine/threonine-protein kinase LECRK1 [Durio zibethinus]
MAMVLAVFLLLLLLCLHVRADQNQQSNLIKLGSSLSPRTDPSSWASPSGHFAFGFYPQGNGFAVGIWIVGLPKNTTVWTANRDDPPVSSNATLNFTRDGVLVLRTEDGRERPIADLEDTADSASMLDTGNFVLYNNSDVIWESFDHPTNTLLGGQNLTQRDSLISAVSSSNHSSGIFLLRMQSDGNLVAYVNNSGLPETDAESAYWASGTSGSDFSLLNLNKRGLLRLFDYHSNANILANSSYAGSKRITIYRATIDPDGIFRMYLHHFFDSCTNSCEKVVWQNLEDRCEVKGYCGLNSYCSGRGNDTDCYCYPGFTVISDNKTSLGCSQNFTEDDCIGRKYQVKQYNITTLENMQWADNPYSVIQMKKDDCKKSCQEDCYCGAVLYSSGNCNRYKLPLRYGRRSKNMSTLAFIKLIHGGFTNYRTPMVPSSPTVINEENPHLLLSVAISLGSITCLCFALAISGFLIYKHRIHSYRKHSENKITPGLTEQFTIRSFSFIELREATDNFKEELGRGSFGAVYKGTLPVTGGTKIVAIKKLENVEDGEREFQKEMTAIGRTNHRNLVRLLGYCVEGSKKLLVYEYLSNGSLADFLFHNKVRPIWKERVRIALDVAKGILYLHEECVVRIIHCNIRPQNILLDDSLTAKISDFGLAKLLMANQTSVTGIKITGGHLAPEWQRNAPISVKVDVYSFGIVLLEIICCRSSIELKVCTADEILLSSWAYNCFHSGELNKLVEDEEVDLKMLERMVKVGLWCIQDDPTLRPSMKNVILMLEGTMDVPIPPYPLHYSLDV